MNVLEKWEKVGLMNGIKQEHKPSVCVLLENQRIINDRLLSDSETYNSDYRKGLFRRISIPIIRRIWGNSTLWDMVSVQPLLNTTGLTYYKDQYGRIKDREGVCKTRKLHTCIPLITKETATANELSLWMQDGEFNWFLEEGYLHNPLSPIMLDNECDMTLYLSNAISNEIIREVCLDLLNNVVVNQKTWKSPANLTDVIFVEAERITRGTGHSANWLISSPHLIIEMAKSGNFVAIPDYKADVNRIEKVGTLGKINVFVDPKFQIDKILLGYKGDNYTAGYFYCPYICLQEELISEKEMKYGLITSYYKCLNQINYYCGIAWHNHEWA